MSCSSETRSLPRKAVCLFEFKCLRARNRTLGGKGHIQLRILSLKETFLHRIPTLMLFSKIHISIFISNSIKYTPDLQFFKLPQLGTKQLLIGGISSLHDIICRTTNWLIITANKAGDGSKKNPYFKIHLNSLASQTRQHWLELVTTFPISRDIRKNEQAASSN